MQKYYAVVIFDRPLEPLSYTSGDDIAEGSIVQVPLGRQSCTGIITEVSNTKPAYDGQLRNIIEIVDPLPFISAPLMATLRFMAKYYAIPIGFCLKLALPGGMMRSGTCRYLAGAEPQELPETTGDDEASKPPAERSLFADETPKLSLTAQLFEALRANSNGLSEKDIRQTYKISAEQFQAWICDGTLVPFWTLDKSRMTESTEKRYEMVPGAVAAKKLGSKQQAILDFIQDADSPVKHSDILGQFGSCNPTLERLESLGLIQTAVTTRDKTSFDDIQPIVFDIERTDEQNAAIDAIVSHDGFGSFLLFGVTGSGKTEVYLGVMKQIRKQGRGCIFILPEIALTPQFCAVFKGRFGDDVAVLHSGLGEHERFDTWSRIRSGRIGIAIGPRSALFAPVQNLGLIVIDEEHDSSFKQGDTPRYHARDMALYLGQQCKCPVILGSATPSLESYSRALTGKSTMLTLTQRPMARPMPQIEIVDMRNRPKPDFSAMPDLEEDEKKRLELKNRLLSDNLILAIRETLARREQAIIFLNRRGFSTFVQCEYCGNVLYCPNCDVALTYYKYADNLHCHYCDYVTRPDAVCSRCGRAEISYTGYGTERLVDVLQHEFTGARIDRLDRDRASTRGIQNVLGAFRNGDLDILVGTQMLAKGHDIHNVTLVGIVNADMSLHMPDFRSSERTYQLLTQVSGRAGRGDRPGRVILQTLKPDHPAIRGIIERNYPAFAAQELEIRRALSNPPFTSLVLFRFEGQSPTDTESYAIQFAGFARDCKPNHDSARVLGPAPAPIPMLCGKMRYQLYIRHSDRGVLHKWLGFVLNRSKEFRQKHESQVKCIVDVDPYDML